MVIVGLIINILLSLLIAHGASKRNRSAVGFFFLSFFLSFIIAGIVLLILGEKQVEGSSSITSSNTSNSN